MKRLIKKANGMQALVDIVTDPNISYLMEYMGSLLNPDTDTLDAVKSVKQLKDNLEYIKMYGKDFFNRLIGLKPEVEDAADVVQNFDGYKNKYVNSPIPAMANNRNKMKRTAELEADTIEHIQTNQILQTLDYPLITQLLYKTKEIYNHLKELNEQETQDEQDKLEELIDFYQNLLNTQQDVPNEIAKVVELQTDIINAESLQ